MNVMFRVIRVVGIALALMVGGQPRAAAQGGACRNCAYDCCGCAYCYSAVASGWRTCWPMCTGFCFVADECNVAVGVRVAPDGSVQVDEKALTVAAAKRQPSSEATTLQSVSEGL